MIIDGIKATGVVSFVDVATGEVMESKNTVLTLGKEWIAQRCTGQVSSLITHIGVGTTATPVSLSDSALFAEIGRAPLTVSGAVIFSSKNVMRFEATFGAGVAVGALVEAGLFTSALGGTCVARTVFSVKNKDPDDIFSVIWEITIN